MANGKPRAGVTPAQVAEKYKAGWNTKDMAAHFKVSTDTIERRVNEANKLGLITKGARKAPPRMERCKSADSYRGTKPPKCNQGNPCKACWDIYHAAQKAKTDAPPPRQSLYAKAIMSEREKKADWSATREDCIKDLRRVQTENESNFISRNFYRVRGKYSDSTWNQHFGSFSQFRRDAGLELSRSQHHLEKKIARHSHLDIYRQFFREEIEPWAGKYELQEHKSNDRIRKVLVGSDFHDIESDPFVLSVFLDAARRTQPDIIVLNGDVYDQYEFSYFSQDPREVNIRSRYEFVRDNIFKPLRRACPNAQIDFIIGNHEQRVLRLLADRTPAFRILADLVGVTFSQLLQLDEYQINLVCKLDLAAYNAKEMTDELKKNYKVYYKTLAVNHISDDDYGLCTVTAHTHKCAMKSKSNEIRGRIWHLTTGGIVKIDAGYQASKTNSQQSFVLVHIDTFEFQAVPEHVVFTDKFAVMGGIYYFRPEQEELEAAA